jgi:transposase
MLARIIVMSFTDGITSSRKIERQVKENIAYMYLAGGETPKYHTISDFKTDCSELIEEVLVTIIAMAKECGMVTLNTISIDGTTIKANASSKTSLDEESLKIAREHIQESIKTDKEEDEKYGDKIGYEVVEELTTPKKVR